MKIIVNRTLNNMICAITQVSEVVENGILCDEFILGVPEGNMDLSPFDIYEVETVPTEVEKAKYCYDPVNGFTVNANYKPRYRPEEEIEKLKASLEETQNTLNILLGA
jgi:hypothetical protein